MNIFAQLFKPFIPIKRQPKENINFEAEPSEDAPTDARPVMYITASPPPTQKIRKSSTSSTASSGKVWPFQRNSGNKVAPENTTIKKQLSIIEEQSMSDSQSPPPPPHCIHPYQILLNTLYHDPEENLDDYEFHCTNISENLKPYITKHNHLVRDIAHIHNYNDIIEAANHRSISCPDITRISWKPPQQHGLENSTRIVPDYYFQTYRTIQKMRGSEDSLLDIDYLFMIKDDIRNMRKLNKYQIDYIQSLDDHTKNEILQEFHKACNSMIDTIATMRSRETTPSSSCNNLLLRAAEALETNCRAHLPRTSSI